MTLSEADSEMSRENSARSAIEPARIIEGLDDEEHMDDYSNTDSDGDLGT